jgi:hypothetical protein
LIALLSSFFSSLHADESSSTATAASSCDAVSNFLTSVLDTSSDVPDEAKSDADLSADSRHNSRRVLDRILAREQDGDVFVRAIELLKERNAHRCWHKHSTFLDHLVGVADILRLWNQDELLRLVGLFHSAYSNSYVNLALLDPKAERHVLRDAIGSEAEKMVFLFCSIDRQEIVVNTLLKQGLIPKEGLTVPNIRGGADVYLSPETLFRLVVFTAADTSDQYFGWQDALWGGGGTAGSMLIPGEDAPERHNPTVIWPGISRPGLWMSYVSRLAQVAATYTASLSLPMPPIFDSGSHILSVEKEAKARDLYWSVVTEEAPADAVESTLEQCISANPWAFEPRVLLAQKRLQARNFTGAVEAATRALELQHQWGTTWDKRVALGAWVAWTRVLLQRAQSQEPWPSNSWMVNNFGLVKDE